MACKNRCVYLPNRPFKGHHIRRSYAEGYRACGKCYLMILFDPDSNYCPCCGQKVRVKSKCRKRQILAINCAIPQIISKA